MSQDHWEIVQRLGTAQARTGEAYEDTYKGRDLHPGTEIAGAWPFITAAYSGIEQTFKFLIAGARGQTVEQLVATRGPKGSKGKAQQPYRHHHLGRLYESLEEPIRAELAEQYRRFRTLHPYIGPATARKFLNAVSAQDGRGYELWRYSLTAPETKLPQNSVAALLWIWDVAVQLCEPERDGWELTGVYERLRDGFAWSLEEILDKLNMERIGEGQANDDVGREAAEWIEAHGGPVNAYAALVHRAHRGLLPAADAGGLSDLFAASLKAWVLKDHGDAVKPQSDVRVFVDRATGYRGPGRSVRWNHETNGFEDMPWELPQTTADAPPAGSYRFEHDGRTTRRLQEMRRVFKQGFQVRENYPATEEMPAGKWLCTLLGEKEVAPGDKLTVRFWEHADDRRGFHVEVEGAEDCREGRLVREVVRLGSEGARAKGARIVHQPEGESDG